MVAEIKTKLMMRKAAEFYNTCNSAPQKEIIFLYNINSFIQLLNSKNHIIYVYFYICLKTGRTEEL